MADEGRLRIEHADGTMDEMDEYRPSLQDEARATWGWRAEHRATVRSCAERRAKLAPVGGLRGHGDRCLGWWVACARCGWEVEYGSESTARAVARGHE